jgi:hypothetical protein
LTFLSVLCILYFLYSALFRRLDANQAHPFQIATGQKCQARPSRAKRARHAPDRPRNLLSLDKVEESTSYGTPAFKVRGALFIRLHDKFDSTIVVRTDFDQREELLAADPETYFITDHYRNYPWVLVRLSRVHPDALRDLLRMAHRLAVSSKRRSSRH